MVLLQAKAGAPLSAVVLLENMARLELADHLPMFFGQWESWEVEVLDSHVAYPLLGYFRSSHDNLSWISALGTVLDTATLVLTTIEDVPRGQAQLVRDLGTHLVEDIYQSRQSGRRRWRPSTGRRSTPSMSGWVPRAIASSPRRRHGPPSPPPASAYADRLEAMAAFWVAPSVSWFGGSDPLRSPTHRPDSQPAALPTRRRARRARARPRRRP